MDFKIILPVDLGMFGEGAAAAAAGDGAAPANTGAQGDTKSAVPGRTHRGKTGEADNVLYGKQEAAASAEPKTESKPEPKAAESAAPATPEDLRKAFKAMVNGEYKDIYAEETQKLINRRFSETRSLETQIQAQQPVIEMLAQRYNVTDGDMAKLAKAIEDDNSYWQEAAEQAGMEVEQYKNFRKLQRENEAFRALEQKRQNQERAQQQAQEWYRQADALKAKYPALDIGEELKNKSFVSMLQSGTPVEVAYQALHFDELMNNAVQATAADAEKRVVDNVKAKGTRPAENGTASRSGFTVKDDVSKLSRADRAEIARQAMRGKKITF